MQFQELLHVKVLHCPYASAKIKCMDIDAAFKVPGVTSVNSYGNLPEQCKNWGINAPAIVPVLHDYGCYAGDVVAVIAAETEQAAEEARDLIKVEYEGLKPVLIVKEAIQPGAPLVHPDTFPTGNIVFPVIPYVGEDMMMHLVRGDADKAFAECDFVDESEAHEAHYDSLGCPAAMEPPVVVWKYNAAHNDFHAWASTQTPHGYRLAAMNCMAGMKNDTTVVNVGGGFGNKAPIKCAMMPIVDCLVKKAGLDPVKFLADIFTATGDG